MAIAPVSQVRSSQPDRFVNLAIGNPLIRGLALLWNGATPQFSHVGGPATGINGVTPVRPYAQGASPVFNGSNVDVRWNRAVTGTNPTEATMFARVYLGASATEYTIMGMSRSSSANPLFRIQRNGTGFWQAQFRGDGATFTNVSGGSAPTSYRVYDIVGVFRSGTGQKELWIDGLQRATSTTDIGTITLDQTEIGSLVRNSAAQFWNGGIFVAGIYNRALPDLEIKSLSANPWQLFEPEPIHIYWPSAGGNTSITPSSGVVTIVGYAADVASPSAATPSVGGITLTGLAASVSSQFASFPASGQISIAGYAPTALQVSAIQPDAGAINLQGYAPGLAQGYLTVPQIGQIQLAGYAPSVLKADSAAPQVGTLTLLGYQPGVSQQLFVIPGAGSIVLQGASVVVPTAGVAVPDVATLTILGYQPGVYQQLVTIPGVGQISLTSYQPSVSQQSSGAPSVGAITLDGKQAFVTRQDFVVPGVGAIDMQGQLALVEGGQYRLPGVGTVTFLGYQPSVSRNDSVYPQAGGIALQGAIPTIVYDSGSAVATPSAGQLGLMGYAANVVNAVFIDGSNKIWYAKPMLRTWMADPQSRTWH